jgi:hypothetical protein
VRLGDGNTKLVGAQGALDALGEGLEGNRREIIGANGGQRSAIAPERRPNGVADVGRVSDYAGRIELPNFLPADLDL